MRDLEEIKEHLSKLVRPVDGGAPRELQRQLELASMPTYIQGISDILEGMDKLKEHLEACPEETCYQATCPGREPHLRVFKVHMEGPILRAEGQVTELYDALIRVVHEFMNCPCPACTQQRQADAAPFN